MGPVFWEVPANLGLAKPQQASQSDRDALAFGGV